MKYVANSLEDVAKFFEERAASDKKLSLSAKPIEAKVIKGRSITWQLAADFLRNCEIKG